MVASAARNLLSCPYAHLYLAPARTAGETVHGPPPNVPRSMFYSRVPHVVPHGPARLSRVQCRAESETLYEVLGVPESATTKEIKAAYRKKAMKLHPDVNKAPNAKEQFMECKTAYDTLMDDKSRAAYDRARKGGFASGIGGDFGADWDSFGQYARRAAQSTRYTYSDLMSDLDRELEEWQREREKKKGRRAEGPSDVLTDIAEEFLEFLEMGAGLGSDDKARPSSGASGATSSTRPTGDASASSAGPDAGGGQRRTRTTGTQTETEAESAFRQAAEEVRREAEAAQARGARAAAAAQERARREQEKAAEVEDELAALKRKLGL